MWIPSCVEVIGVVVCQKSTGFLTVSSLAASVAEPELAGVESTVTEAQVVGNTGQWVAVVHTAEVAEHPEDLPLRRCTSQVHGVHRLS